MLCSLLLVVRIGFWLVALGFALGLVVGVGVVGRGRHYLVWCHCRLSRRCSLAFAGVRRGERCPMHTHSVLIAVVQVLTTLLG